jgi:hypothetical protein
VRQRTAWTAATAAILVAGCSGDSRSGSAGPGQLASETADQIVHAAQSATSGISGYEIKGSGDFGNGLSAFEFQVHGKNLEGSLTLKGHGCELDRVDGNIYLNGPQSFWSAEGLNGIEASLLANQWVEAPAGSAAAGEFSQLSTLTDISSDLSQHGTLVHDGTGTVNGQPVVLVKDTSDGSVLAVDTSGPAYPARLTRSGSSATTVEFSDWTAVPEITPPPQPLVLPNG